MKKKPGKNPLRAAAEAQLIQHAPAIPVRPAEELLHELQVQRIELEMQNDELRRAQIALEESRDRYLDLYDFAPVGYLTLTREALIAEINLTGATLLGEERGKLLQRRFSVLVPADQHDRWHQHFMRALQHDGKHSCELQLLRSGRSRFHAHLTSLRLTKNDAPPMLRISLTDVTELRDAEERYSKLFDEASDAIAFADADTGELLELNQALADMVERDKSELLGQSQKILHPDTSSSPVSSSFEHHRTDKLGEVIETEVITRDGKRRNVAIRASAITLHGRKMLFGIFRDITERKHSEERERRLRHILDSTLDMIFIFAPDTLHFVYMNKGAIENSGYSQERLLQMAAPEVIPQLPEQACRTFLAPLISGKKETLRCETILRRQDGSDLPVEVQIQLVREEEEDSGLFVAIVRDITARKLAEKEFWQQKSLMWQVIDSDPNMIFVKDASGKFILANQTMADFYGVTIQNLIGKNNREIHPHTQDVDGFLASDRDVIESKREVTLTEAVRLPNGRQYWYLTVKRPLLQADGSVNVLGIAVDITELKQSEIKLAESYAKLQRLSLYLENARADERAKIALNLHDEMGATLAAMKMRVAWLASKLPPDMPHLATEAAHIAELVSDGIRIVRQIVTQLRPNLLDDIGLVAALKDYVKIFEQHTKIECTLVLPEEEFALDRDQSATVFRIIQESLNNVAKHAQASHVEIIIALHDGSLHLAVKDNGIGFDPAAPKEHSFGLLGIKERALMVDGEATIDSAPGRGTQVSVNIPDLASVPNWSI